MNILSAAYILNLPRPIKRMLVMVGDVLNCGLACWIAVSLRIGDFVDVNDQLIILSLVSFILAVSIFVKFGLYDVIFRYSGRHAFKAISGAMCVYTVPFASVSFVGLVEGIPRSVGLIQPMVLFFAVSASRLIPYLLLQGHSFLRGGKATKPRVLIYGAGAAGRQLASGLTINNEMKVVGFVDDDNRLMGRRLDGQRIFARNELAAEIKRRSVTHILLAMPSVPLHRHKAIIRGLSEYNVVVRRLPSLADLAEGRVKISDIRELDIDELLDRNTVLPNEALMSAPISGKTVLITGAGGSIGSELSRQVINWGAKTLILLEINEYALYAIHNELLALQKNSPDETFPEIVPLLCSVQDRLRVNEVIKTWLPDTIYHAAAYKHVPIVEHNLAEGLKNNLFGTLVMAESARQMQVKDFVLISTDKAVRPTNIMGATKRLAEMTIQALQDQNDGVTRFSMVRFGNVLDSSGSVIPKFKQQILDGGPLTVTHPEVNRFFMTIPEAAQLVIQASALAKGGDVFLLDMGVPVKILDLAKRLISLSGLSVRNEANPDGDIEILITGLRPGEKLYEELLICGTSEATSHPKIMRAREEFMNWDEFQLCLASLKEATSTNNVRAMSALIQELVQGYSPESDFVDWLHVEREKRSRSL